MTFSSSLHPVVCMRVHVFFTLFMFVCALWCPTHIVLCFCFGCLCLVYPVLPISLDCSFLIAPSVYLYHNIIHHNTLQVQTVIDQNAREMDEWSKMWLMAFNPEN